MDDDSYLQIEDIVDERSQMRSAGPDDVELFAGGGVERPIDFAEKDVGKAEDRIERRAELVAQRCQEGGLFDRYAYHVGELWKVGRPTELPARQSPE